MENYQSPNFEQRVEKLKITYAAVFDVVKKYADEIGAKVRQNPIQAENRSGYGPTVKQSMSMSKGLIRIMLTMRHIVYSGRDHDYVFLAITHYTKLKSALKCERIHECQINYSGSQAHRQNPTTFADDLAAIGTIIRGVDFNYTEKEVTEPCRFKHEGSFSTTGSRYNKTGLITWVEFEGAVSVVNGKIVDASTPSAEPWLLIRFGVPKYFPGYYGASQQYTFSAGQVSIIVKIEDNELVYHPIRSKTIVHPQENQAYFDFTVLNSVDGDFIRAVCESAINNGR